MGRLEQPFKECGLVSGRSSLPVVTLTRLCAVNWPRDGMVLGRCLPGFGPTIPHCMVWP